MLIHADSFDDRPYSFIGDRYDAGSAAVAIAAGRTDNAAQLTAGILDQPCHLDKSFTNRQTVIVGVARQNSLPTALCSIRDEGTPHIFAQLNSDRTISVIRYDAGSNTVLGTSSELVPSSGFFYLELKAKIATTVAGAYELRVDGVTWLLNNAVVTASTANEFANRVRLIYNAGIDDARTLVDDFYIADDDTDGGDANVSDFAGPVKIKAIQVNGNGFVNSWTPNTGTNSDAVKEFTGEDGDATYVGSEDDNAIDLYNLAALGVNNVDIVGVAVNQWIRREDMALRQAKPVARTSSANYFKGEISAGLTYAATQSFFEKNPASGDVWLYTDIDALQVGIQAILP